MVTRKGRSGIDFYTAALISKVVASFPKSKVEEWTRMLLVLYSLRDGQDGERISSGYRAIAKALGVSEARARYFLDKLVADGFLVRERSQDGSTSYRFEWDWDADAYASSGCAKTKGVLAHPSENSGDFSAPLRENQGTFSAPRPECIRSFNEFQGCAKTKGVFTHPRENQGSFHSPSPIWVSENHGDFSAPPSENPGSFSAPPSPTPISTTYLWGCPGAASAYAGPEPGRTTGCGPAPDYIRDLPRGNSSDAIAVRRRAARRWREEHGLA